MWKNAPDAIRASDLGPNDVFVFGSNAQGLHGGGAALFAYNHLGAVWGEGEGLFGQSYALPTMGSDDELEAAVGRFLVFASEHPKLTFLVTKVGTGIAGRSVKDIARLFKSVPSNVVLPVEFEKEN
ncbi:A1S_2505 family phage non-structural protein [Gryllotalpicola koreensis]|uniref:Uncharacterized protein n=1 Tax=Gryllotalpicola koreensis TaxID=993086 RepID=A0ABP8A201_9MICO